ncbi:hypothetical protein Tco_0094449 [Tanacetum coccineum]
MLQYLPLKKSRPEIKFVNGVSFLISVMFDDSHQRGLWMCFPGLGGLHYLLDKVVQAGMYRDLSLPTSGSLQDPTTAIITTITITNGDGMQRVRTLRETISPE